MIAVAHAVAPMSATLTATPSATLRRVFWFINGLGQHSPATTPQLASLCCVLRYPHTVWSATPHTSSDAASWLPPRPLRGRSSQAKSVHFYGVPLRLSQYACGQRRKRAVRKFFTSSFLYDMGASLLCD